MTVGTIELEALEKMVDLCRAKGIASLSLGGVSIVMGPPPVDMSALQGHQVANEAAPAGPTLSDDEKWWASGLRPTRRYADRFRSDDDDDA